MEGGRGAVGEKLQPDDHHVRSQGHDDGDKDLRRDVLGVCGTCPE